MNVVSTNKTVAYFWNIFNASRFHLTKATEPLTELVTQFVGVEVWRRQLFFTFWYSETTLLLVSEAGAATKTTSTTACTTK